MRARTRLETGGQDAMNVDSSVLAEQVGGDGSVHEIRRLSSAKLHTGRQAAVQVLPYRWRVSGSFLAHLVKATTQQHHRALTSTIARLVPADAVVFDIGAHAGQYTKLFARAAGLGRVYAFEPGSYARSILRTVVWLHRLSNVVLVPIALGSDTRLDTLNVPIKGRSSLGFGLSHLGQPSGRWAAVAQEIVAQTTIDEVVKALDLERLDFIKADIEGWELRLLHGAESTLARFRPRLLLELTGAALARAGDRLDDAFAFLAAHGYLVFRFEPGAGLVPTAAPADGDFWLIPAEDSARSLSTGDLADCSATGDISPMSAGCPLHQRLFSTGSYPSGERHGGAAAQTFRLGA
jgi:FkbM family methyltransferase